MKREKLWDEFEILEARVGNLKGVVQNELGDLTKEDKEQITQEFVKDVTLVQGDLSRLMQDVVGYVKEYTGRTGDKGMAVIEMSFLQPYIEKGYRRFFYDCKSLKTDNWENIECTEEQLLKLVEMIFKEEGIQLGNYNGTLVTGKYKLVTSRLGGFTSVRFDYIGE